MAQTAPAIQDGLEAFAQKMRPDLDPEQSVLDQLIEEYLAAGNALRMKNGADPITRKGAQKTLAAALVGGGMIDLNRQALADVLRCPFEEIKKRTLRRRQSGLAAGHEGGHNHDLSQGTIRVYESWQAPEIQHFIAAARETILFVDTWFDEGPYFAARIEERKKLIGAQSVKIKIYMLSNSTLGGLRMKEIQMKKEAYVSNKSDEDFKREYEENFNVGIRSAWRDLNDECIDLELYGYDFMPGPRLMIIDNEKYIFSWFPLGTVSAKYMCFCLSTDPSDQKENVVVTNLRNQIAIIEGNSSPIHK